MSGMQDYTEIPLADVASHTTIVWEVLEEVCESPSFRTSPKSCEFLRHVVDRCVAGEPDELKERLIGMSLLGRKATYDTASDAGVRVRANDVRKRLIAYNAASKMIGAGTFELPSGSYIPRFYRSGVALPQPAAPLPPAAHVATPYETSPMLSLQRLATPTFVALFLCVMCLRWQVAQENPFITFWQSIFQHGPVLLYLPPADASGAGQVVGMSEIEASAAILNLAGQFRSEVTLAENPHGVDDKTLIAFGDLHSGGGTSLDADERFTMANTPSGRRIVDQRHPAMSPAGDAAAALLTIENSPNRRITIDGTDRASIKKLVRLLCDRDAFPDVLADNDQSGETLQYVLPMTPGAQPIFFRDTARPSSKPQEER